MARTKKAASAEAAFPIAQNELTQRRVWNREIHAVAQAEGRSEVAHFWDEFLDGAQACFWGLSFREGLMAKRLASDVAIGDDFQRTERLNDEKLPLVMIAMSARGGDGAEWAYDPAQRLPRTLLDPQSPADLNLIASMGSARINFLATQVEHLSAISMPRIAEHLLFFQLTTRSLFECTNTLIPSTIALLTNFSERLAAMPTEEWREAVDRAGQLGEEWLRMQMELQDLSGSAGTLLRGSSTVAITFHPTTANGKSAS